MRRIEQIAAVTTAMMLVAGVWWAMQIFEHASTCSAASLVQKLHWTQNDKEMSPCAVVSLAGDTTSSQLVGRLKNLAALRGIFPSQKKGLTLRIWNERPFTYSEQPRAVNAGTAIVRSRGQLERVVILNWLGRVFPHLREHRFELEVFADFFTLLLKPSQQFQNPVSGRSYELGQYASSRSGALDEYCNSQDISVSHMNFCRKYNSTQIQNSTEYYTPWIYRTALSSYLWQRYVELSRTEQQQFFVRLKALWSRKGAVFKGRRMSSFFLKKDKAPQQWFEKRKQNLKAFYPWS